MLLRVLFVFALRAVCDTLLRVVVYVNGLFWSMCLGIWWRLPILNV